MKQSIASLLRKIDLQQEKIKGMVTLEKYEKLRDKNKQLARKLRLLKQRIISILKSKR